MTRVETQCIGTRACTCGVHTMHTEGVHTRTPLAGALHREPRLLQHLPLRLPPGTPSPPPSNLKRDPRRGRARHHDATDGAPVGHS
eukprot:3529723-Rhodomonas_salina.2